MIITGRLVTAAAAGAILILAFPRQNYALLWIGFVVLVGIVDMLLAASPRSVEITRTVPGSVRLTQSTSSILLVRNPGRRTVRAQLRDAWVPSAGASRNRHQVTLPGGEAQRLRTVLTPIRRGDLDSASVTVRSYGPLGMAGRNASIPAPTHLRVLPEFASRRHLPSRLAQLREMDGRAAIQVRGEGTEFDSLRQYVMGDDVRSIDWRATARRSEVVVRTWRPERDRRVLIVIDSSRTSAVRAEEGTRLDAAIEASLLLGVLASHAGDRVDVVAFDRQPRARVAGITGPRLLPEMAEALCGIEPALVEADWPGIVNVIRTQLSQRALVVLVTALDPAPLEEGLMPVLNQLTSRHRVVLASVATDDDAGTDSVPSDQDGFDLAARARASLDREAMTTVLRGSDVTVVDSGASQLAPQLADTYLMLKATGRL